MACEIPETNPRRVRGRESVVSKQASEPRGAEPLMSPKRIFHQINKVRKDRVRFDLAKVTFLHETLKLKPSSR